jgi:hypothetical protein
VQSRQRLDSADGWKLAACPVKQFRNAPLTTRGNSVSNYVRQYSLGHEQSRMTLSQGIIHYAHKRPTYLRGGEDR